MSFVSPFQTEFFVVDRVTTQGRLVRRVISLASDGAVLMCKPSGLVCRVMHAGNLFNLVVSPWEGIANVGVLFRFDNEPDLLFRHILPQREVAAPANAGGIDFVVSSQLLRTAQRFLQCVNLLRQNAGIATDVARRNSLEELVGSSDLHRFSQSRKKPEFSPVTGSMLLPTIFDVFEVYNTLSSSSKASPLSPTKEGPGFGHAVPEPVNMFVDISFLAMLSHALERSPLAATTAPLLTIEAPAPFKSVVVNDKFFEAFTAAYCQNLSLVVNAHGPLPHLVSFRASPVFWQFVKKRNHLARPAPRALSNLLADHVEVYLAGEESATTICMPLVEWNQTIVDWELQVRARTDASDDKLSKAYREAEESTADESMWASFLQEAHLAMHAYNSES